MILNGIHLSVHNCVISIQMHVLLDFLFDVIYTTKKQCWAKDGALGNSWCYIAPGGMQSIRCINMDSVAQNIIFPYLG